ncbi:alpha/beta hydrolase [Nocardia heshunensis]
MTVRILRATIRTTVGVILCALASITTPVARADGPPLDQVAHLDHVSWMDANQMTVGVYSAAMDRVIEQDVLIPDGGSAGRPTAYLLVGAARDDQIVWQTMTDLPTFAPGTGVNVVIPHGGESSYYTDWQRDDPVLGRNKWATYLTSELPPIMDAVLHATGRNAIVGLSMSSTAALALAEAAPSLYQAVGAFSGCAETSKLPGQAYVYVVTDIHGGGNVENMWGPFGSPAWSEHDPYLHADRLRGHTLYIASGTGFPGTHDNLGDYRVGGDVPTLLNQLIQGGAIEAAASDCTAHLAARLADLGIPATYRSYPGTHSWGYWQDDLHDFWPVMAAAIGA